MRLNVNDKIYILKVLQNYFTFYFRTNEIKKPHKTVMKNIYKMKNAIISDRNRLSKDKEMNGKHITKNYAF